MTSTPDAIMILTCHGWIVHSRRQYPLGALEQAQVHHFCVRESDRLEFGGILDIDSLILKKTSSCRDLVAMVGDSWDLATQGSFQMWLLSIVDIDTDNTIPCIPINKRQCDDGDTDATGESPAKSTKSRGSRRSIMIVYVSSSDED